MSVRDFQYLIIGGAPKAGTTSLYKWLVDHPDVCASTLKETRFFLDENYPLPSAVRFDGGNLEEYGSFFNQRGNDGHFLRLDSTPDYLYSENALLIAQLLPNSKIVFILRDPVERMVSWFNYARQRGMIDMQMSFDEYAHKQIGRIITPETPMHMRALEQGKYEKYLPNFQRVFGDRLLVIHFNEIKHNPRALMQKICLFTGLNFEVYYDYKFNAENVTRATRLPKMEAMHNMVRRELAYASKSYPKIRAILKIPNQLLKKALSYTHKSPEGITVPKELEELILKESKVNAE
jgi:hypothetical protein